MSFSEITNQDHVINFLRACHKSKRIAGAYLFMGKEGTGRSKAAREFAKLLNCQEGNGDSCDKCTFCQNIDQDKSPDLHWYSPANNSITISQIRDLEKYMSLKPYEAKYKFFIIIDAHCLTEEASNALLKTLEEPAKDSIIILIANGVANLLPTISSRCQKIVFNSLDESSVKDILMHKYKIPLLQAHFISYLAEGSLGKAISYKDLKDDLLEKREHILNAIYFRKFSVFRMEEFAIKDSKERRKNLNLLLDILLAWFRDLLIIKSGVTATLINLDKREDLSKLDKKYSEGEIINNISSIANTKAMLDLNVNVKLAISKMRADLWK